MYEYIVPRFLNLPESRVVSYELFDDLLNRIFGIHFLEPVVTFQDLLKVKPLMKGGMSSTP